MTTIDRTGATDEEFAAHLARWEAADRAFVETTADQLDRSHFGFCVSIPARGSVGYLYAVHDDFHDGYPGRLIVLVDDEGNAAEEEFSDSDPAGYPKTMRTPCLVEVADSEPVELTCPDCESPFHGRPCPRAIAALRPSPAPETTGVVDVNGCPDAAHHGVDCPGDACRFAALPEVASDVL